MQRTSQGGTEQVEYQPAECYIIAHGRHKYRCRCCKQGVMTADLSLQPIEKGLAGPSLLAEIILNKYQDHNPLHRQEQRFARLA